jgi:iron complex outermembrane receptor protein
MPHSHRSIAHAIAAILALPAAAFAANTDASADEEGVFTLGEVTVIGERLGDATDDNRVSAAEVWKFNANTLTDAVKLVPGVTSNFISNGRRNEGDISVRGFDRWRVPLSIDGIRVYLPADNRIDFNRFLTPDLGEIQVRKGRVSVLDGPGAMGGAINLVTRKPVKDFEAEFQGGASFDRGGSYDGWFGTGLVGGRHGDWYFQASGTQIDRDSWTLSKDFTPVALTVTPTPAVAAAVENGGKRDGSASKDWRVNAKLGWEPNETDEYSLSFTKQSGEKGAPLGTDFIRPDGNVNNPPYQPNNFWTWPYWDTQSAYWLSHTQFGDSYLKTRLSYSEFDNALYAWDDALYTSQSAMGRFRSYYHDSSFGGSVEVGTSFIAGSTTRAAFHWRRDRHREYNFNRPTSPAASSEPMQHSEEQTWSLALEQAWSAGDAVDLVAGISYDSNDLKQAQEYGGTPARLYDQPLGDSDAVNGQLAATWRYADNAEFGASISSRTRFPTNFERYSTRFGTAVPNPDLGTERATNFEVDWKIAPVEDATFSTSVFYTDVKDLIQTVIVVPSPQQTQTQNVGDGSFYGIELAGDYQLSPQLRAGANYSYLHRKIKDALQPNLEATGVPTHLGFAYLAWEPVATVTVQPSLEFAGNRWTDRNGNTGLGYQRIGRYTLANLQVSWQPLPNVEAVFGTRNLFDKNFQLAAGFPEPGRSLFTKVRVTF